MNGEGTLEQSKANLVTPDAWIEAQHVVGERRELTHQFHADQSAADDDNRQTLAPRRRQRVRSIRSGDFSAPAHPPSS
jgi:hypothetical protein